jgi:hypothetical protein
LNREANSSRWLFTKSFTKYGGGEEVTPQEWEYGIIRSLDGVGNVMMCDNYRAVILLYKIYKILENILYLKLLPSSL